MHNEQTSLQKPICFRVGDNPPQVIPANQEARLLCDLWDKRPRKAMWDDLYQAIGESPEVNRCLSTLRNKWHIPILCELTKKAGRKGQYGLYSLPAEVRVWKLEAGNAG